jgi:hypothetical protein
MQQPAPLPCGVQPVDPGALHRAFVVGGAEVILEIHAGRERFARAGQHHHGAALVHFQGIEDFHHLLRHLDADGVLLVGTVHRHPGDAVLEIQLYGFHGV